MVRVVVPEVIGEESPQRLLVVEVEDPAIVRKQQAEK